MCCKIVGSTQVILCVLHARQSSCMLHESLQLSFAREGSRNRMLADRDKTCGHDEINILSNFYVLLFQSTPDDIVSNQLNAKHNNGTSFRQHRLKCTTGFTREYLSLVSYCSQVQKCTTGVTQEYFQLVSNHSRALYFLCHMSP